MRASTEVWIERQRFGESRFSALVVFRTTKTFEHAVNVTRAQAIMGQRKVWIELDGALEMRNRSVAIVPRQRAKYETRKQIASAQILLVSRGILSGGFADSDLLGGTQLDA